MRAALFSMTITVVLAAGAAGVAFLAGRSLADVPAAYERGVADGERYGRAQGRAEFERGAKRATILAEGRRRGFEEGRRAGVAEGARRGRLRGRRAAFAGFDGGWDIGRWYLVN